MSDDLDAIEWGKVSHAYGPATDLPAALRALAAGDKKERERALWELHGNIWHQGTVYEATALAVPFLLELVRARHTESLRILCLLAVIADGSSYLAVHGKPSNQGEREYQEQVARELTWVAAARRAVGRGRELFLEMVGGEDARMREIAILLLGLTSEGGGGEIGTVEVIEKILEEVS